jgi:hypothetical protein
MMISPVDCDVRLPLLHGFSDERSFDPIKRAQQPESEVVYADPDRGSLFDLDPGMSMVEIVSLGDRDPLHLQDIHGSHHGVDGVFVVEVLIEFAPAAIVVVGAKLKGNPPLQVVEA